MATYNTLLCVRSRALNQQVYLSFRSHPRNVSRVRVYAPREDVSLSVQDASYLCITILMVFGPHEDRGENNHISRIRYRYAGYKREHLGKGRNNGGGAIAQTGLVVEHENEGDGGGRGESWWCAGRAQTTWETRVPETLSARRMPQRNRGQVSVHGPQDLDNEIVLPIRDPLRSRLDQKGYTIATILAGRPVRRKVLYPCVFHHQNFEE